jgi:hypothetical protein
VRWIKYRHYKPSQEQIEFWCNTYPGKSLPTPTPVPTVWIEVQYTRPDGSTYDVHREVSAEGLRRWIKWALVPESTRRAYYDDPEYAKRAPLRWDSNAVYNRHSWGCTSPQYEEFLLLMRKKCPGSRYGDFGRGKGPNHSPACRSIANHHLPQMVEAIAEMGIKFYGRQKLPPYKERVNARRQEIQGGNP